jgi:hypothetical protein
MGEASALPSDRQEETNTLLGSLAYEEVNSVLMGRRRRICGLSTLQLMIS